MLIGSCSPNGHLVGYTSFATAFGHNRSLGNSNAFLIARRHHNRASTTLPYLQFAAKSMTRITRRILQLSLVASCVACMPFPRQLYVPEGAGGRVMYSPCSPENVPSSIEFVIEGITLDVKVDAVTDGRHYIGVRFTMPAAKVVSLQDDKVTFSWASKRPNSESTFPKISRVGGLPINYQNPAVQKYMRAIREPMAGGGNFWLAAYITPPPDGDFSVTLPSIAVNGAMVALPEVRFRKGSFAVIAPVNC